MQDNMRDNGCHNCGNKGYFDQGLHAGVTFCTNWGDKIAKKGRPQVKSCATCGTQGKYVNCGQGYCQGCSAWVHADSLDNIGGSTTNRNTKGSVPVGQSILQALAGHPESTIRKISDTQALCSFCGKGEAQVKRLFTDQGAFICNECIDLCSEAQTAIHIKDNDLLLFDYDGVSQNEKIRMGKVVAPSFEAAKEALETYYGPTFRLFKLAKELSGVVVHQPKVETGLLRSSVSPHNTGIAFDVNFGAFGVKDLTERLNKVAETFRKLGGSPHHVYSAEVTPHGRRRIQDGDINLPTGTSLQFASEKGRITVLARSRNAARAYLKAIGIEYMNLTDLGPVNVA